MMEKSWVWLPRPSNEYQIGARNFVNAATTSLGNPSSMLCPCIDCRNLSHQGTKTMYDHLVIRGMDEKYKRNPCWCFHGDRKLAQPDEDPSSEFEAYDLIRTAFFDSDSKPSNHSEDQNDDVDSAEESEFRKKLQDAETPLYSICPNYTKISAIMGLYMIKVKSGMSENYFDQKELFNKVENLENKLQILTTGKKPDDSSTSELDSSCRQDVRRCQLLDWYSKEEVVVGEGEYCSSEPMYKVADIPIGPNASAVIVRSVLVENASLWRPTKTVDTIAFFGRYQ